MEYVTAWLKDTKALLEKIKKIHISDRLANTSSILQCNDAMGRTLNGWLQWLSNPSIMEHFEEKELKDLLKEFKEVAILFLELDVKYSTSILDRHKKEKEKVLRGRGPIIV